jgi:tight adherence protein C
MPPLLLPILVFFSVLALGGAIVIALTYRRKSIEPRLRSIKGEIAIAPTGDAGLMRMVNRVGEAAAPKEPSSKLKQNLARAGYFGNSAAATYIGIKIVLLVIGLSLSMTVVLLTPFSLAMELYTVAGVSLIFFFIPNLWVASRRRGRQTEVRQHLPDVVDLLEICVSAGMGLDMAWNSVADEIRTVSDVMADEMALTMLESQLGAPRTVAMRHMAERTGAQELASLVALLVQSDRFGTSIADALRTFANSMRESRSQRAEEAAEKTAVKLLFPLVLFIFPVMLIVAVGPTALRLYSLFSTT